MSYLIFCSFEVGGIPYKMAEILNRHGVEVYYVSVADNPQGHDSTYYHYGNTKKSWDLSFMFSDIRSLPKRIISNLKILKDQYKISNCFATGYKSYLLNKAGIQYNYWSYGSDLDQICFSFVWPQNYPLVKKIKNYPLFLLKIRKKARTSISLASSVMIAPYQVDTLNGIFPGKKLFFLPHMISVIDYDLVLKRKGEMQAAIGAKFGTKRYFFSATRHVWSGILSKYEDNKGNNVILKSYCEYLNLSGDYESKLILVAKGPDVEASKALCRDISLDNNVVWVEEMPREELESYYTGATICFGQFGTPVLTFAALEPLARGTIGISLYNCRNSSVPHYSEGPPILESNEPKEIANLMHRIMADKNEYDNLSYRSWKWIKDNCSEEKFVESFLRVMESN